VNGRARPVGYPTSTAMSNNNSNSKYTRNLIASILVLILTVMAVSNDLEREYAQREVSRLRGFIEALAAMRHR